ncbi:MAG: hypothetical protein KDB94_09050 [Acidobacteria bacterium]|nr:hypothetical protein [Acidobacteriota bacterium]
MTPFREQVAELDRALTERGFAREEGTLLVVWRGRWNGRDCVVRAAPQRRTKYVGEVRYRRTLGYRLRAELETNVRTQLFFVREGFASNAVVRWIYKWRKQTAVTSVPDALHGFVAVTIEPAWTERFFFESEAVAAVGRLLTGDAKPSLAGSVHLMPTSEMGKVHYASPVLPLDRITAERTAAVLDDLERIAVGAERIPAPQVVREVGAFGRFAEKHPWATAAGLLFGCMGIVAFGALLFVLAAVALSAVLK